MVVDGGLDSVGVRIIGVNDQQNIREYMHQFEMKIFTELSRTKRVTISHVSRYIELHTIQM
jgi:hypothetical protein